MLPPSARPGHLRTLLVTLERLRPASETDGQAAASAGRSAEEAGLIILISDLLDEPERWSRA